jgi:hypothetical protein
MLFYIISWRDSSEVARLWFKEVVVKMQQKGGNPALGIHVLMGPDFRIMAQNIICNLNENRIDLIECVVQKLSVQ